MPYEIPIGLNERQLKVLRIYLGTNLCTLSCPDESMGGEDFDSCDTCTFQRISYELENKIENHLTALQKYKEVKRRESNLNE